MRNCFTILLLLFGANLCIAQDPVLVQPTRPPMSLQNLSQEQLNNIGSSYNTPLFSVVGIEQLLSDSLPVEGHGELNIAQDTYIDTLVNRAIWNNKKEGVSGVRIQIYYSSVRTAREEASRIRAEFMAQFPNMDSYIEYQEPGWFKVRVGNYHNKLEAYRDLVLIREVYPDAYSVLTTIESQFAENE